jgi:hypothetical protein
MTEPGATCWFRRQLNPSALAGLPGAVMLSPAPVFQLSESGDDSTAGQIELIVAVVAAVIVGLVLISHLVRPLFTRTSPEQPAEPSESNHIHDERWARWEAGNVVTASIPTDQPGMASQPLEDMVIGTLPAIDLPPDQAPSTHEISPNAAIGSSIFAAVTALLDCANDGAMLSGFGLYSDGFFHRFAVDSGLSLDEFVRRYQSPGTRHVDDERLRVERVDNFVNLPDGRVSARIVYGPTGILPPERYVFIWSPDRNRWLIDDILAEP